MLCGKTPQGTRRDTCFKIKHFLIWLIHFVTKRSFSTVTVSVSQPGLDWDQKMTLAFLFMAVHHIQYGKARDIPEDICACCAISIYFKKRSSLQGRENHVKKWYALSLLRDSSWERWPQCHNSHLQVKVDVRETLPEMFYERYGLFKYTK